MARMALIGLLNREVAGSRRDIVVAVLVSGAANTGLLAIINSAAASASFGALNARLLAMFVVAMALYVVGLSYVFEAATRGFEHALAALRVRLMQRIAGSELLLLHEIGKPRIFQAITRDASVISEAQGLLVAAAHSAVMVACTGVYVVSVSPPAFLAIAAVIALGVVLYLAQSRQMNKLIAASGAQEVKFLGMTNDLVDGLKEIKLSHARRDQVLEELDAVAARLCALKIQSTGMYNKSAVFSQGFFYVLIAIIVFVLPRLLEGFAPLAQEMVATVLFIIGPLSTIVTAIPSFTKAEQAAASLMALEDEIERVAGERDAPSSPPPSAPPFAREIACEGMVFRYPGEAAGAFQIGPIDLSIRQGEITMFIGGNGSGKTTLLKVLAGLYTPAEGALALDGKRLGAANLPAYRELFGAIFSDFYLFRKLYGVPAAADAISARLSQMNLAGKVSYGADGFSTTELSTGQRKRVAMAVTLLEDRPVMIFDEWAAEQDPEFRRYFYEKLLPELKSAGKTLLIATHDDRFFDIADTVVKLELGRVQSTRARRPS